ncbi:MAG: class I SAM-dependent methyltransferase [Parcubacteria group bacterium]
MSTDKNSIDWYNANARDYTADSSSSPYHQFYEKPAMYGLIPDIKGNTVLSLGCGAGTDSAYLKSLGADKSVGIDISSEQIKLAKEVHPECEFKVMDMEHLDFSDSTFDFAYSSLAIHYIEDWTTVFKEVYRVLKPNSYFLFSCGHPVKYAMDGANTDTDWVNKLELVKNKETKEYKITGDYVARKKLPDGFGKNTITCWRKSYAEISAEIHSSGFLIEQIIDPMPTEGMKSEFPEKYKKLTKLPEFTIFRLLKK